MTDNVNHPDHYTSHPSGVECIEITEHMNFCIGNAFKYLFRRKFKGRELEDLRKARWYVQREIARRKDERWEVYPSDPRYEVSTQGRIRRIDTGRQRRLVPNKKGYLTLMTTEKGRNRLRYVHRIVAETFLGPCPPGYEVSHLDGNRSHNWIGNLAYESHSRNMSRRVDHGTDCHGGRNPSAKLTAPQVQEIRARLREGVSPRELGKEFGVSRATVERIRNGVSWNRPCREGDVQIARIAQAESPEIAPVFDILWRAGLKGDALEDLKKARWYIEREIQRCEKQRQQSA